MKRRAKQSGRSTSTSLLLLHPNTQSFHHIMLLFLKLLPLIFLLSLRHHQYTHATTFVYAACSPSKADPSSPFLSNLNSLLSTFLSSYSSYSSNNTADPQVFGLFQCRNDLSIPDCTACVRSAVGQLSIICSAAYSAALQLDGCLVRYSSEDFLGRQDTSLVYKKCGERQASSNDGEFYRRRDDVLGDLQNGVGFRVSSSGEVEGYGQCLGDLGPGDCRACLAEAVSQLRNACGSALAANVYLGQCYARYWASGYYAADSSNSDSSDDDVGKTVAIIVGSLAGLAVLVVFLSFLRKALA